MTKAVIIMGSSRSDGNTQKIINHFRSQYPSDLIDLKDYTIGHFDYEFDNSEDDFLPLIKEIITKYDTIIFATPVYWYSMSGRMKVFFDRISDVLYRNKEYGRKLNGKKMGLISCGSGPELNSAFSMPFKETAKYLKMDYKGELHTWLTEDEFIPSELKKSIKNFAQHLMNRSSSKLTA